MELGGFGADEEAEVTIKEVLEMKLIKGGSQFQYKFPTSLFVRYGDTITASASQNSPTDYVLNFNLHSFAGITKITPRPWFGTETSGNTFSFQGNRKVFEKDHDVVLDLALAENYQGVKLTERRHKTDQVMLLSSFMVRVPSTPLSELPAKEYVFVVDCSGSMEGDRIVNARKTLQLLINSLPVDSYFNVVRFGSKYQSLFRRPQEYTKENKEIAMKLAETMDSDLGGTELFKCLRSVVKCKRLIRNYKRQVFVLTDGGISKQDETLKLVKQYAKKNRFFSFGIGSGCSSALVNGLADAGIGAASFITDKRLFEWEKPEGLSSICVKSLMASASQHIVSVKITPPPVAPTEPIKMLVDSTCLNVFYEGFPEKISLVITMANNEEVHVIAEQNMDNIETIESPFEPNVLHKLAAKKIISEWVNSDLSSDNRLGWPRIEDHHLPDVIELSVKEQVLSPFTALVGVVDESNVVGVSQRVDLSELYRLWEPAPPETCLDGGNGSLISSRGQKTDRKSFMRSLLDGASQKMSRFRTPQQGSSAETACTELVDNDHPTSSTILPKPSKEVTAYHDITNEQNPGGEWTMKFKSKHDGALFTNIEDGFSDEVVQFTVYAILLLLADFPETFDEWKLTATKGATFLKKSICDLQGELMKIVSVSTLEIDDEMLFQLLQ